MKHEWGYDEYPDEFIGHQTPCKYELLKFNPESEEFECQGIYAEDEATMMSLVSQLNNN